MNLARTPQPSINIFPLLSVFPIREKRRHRAIANKHPKEKLVRGGGEEEGYWMLTQGSHWRLERRANI